MGIIFIHRPTKMGKNMTPACRDYTLNMHKRLQGIQFKKRAPKAIKTIRKFAQKEMFTKDVRIDTELNRHVWFKGIRNVPRKIRVRVTRKRNEDEDAADKFYCLVQFVECDEFDQGTTKVN